MAKYQQLMLKDSVVIFQSLDAPYVPDDGTEADGKWSITVRLPKDDPRVLEINKAYEAVVAKAKEDGFKAKKIADSPVELIEAIPGKDIEGVGTHVKIKAGSRAWDKKKGQPIARPQIYDKYNRKSEDVPGYNSVVNVGVQIGQYEHSGKRGLGVFLNALMVRELVQRDTDSLFADYAESPSADFEAEVTAGGDEAPAFV